MNPESPNPLLVVLAGLLSVLAVALASACTDAGSSEAPATATPAATSTPDPPDDDIAAGTIAALIDAAAPGDTVLVPAGTYRETVEITKPVTLQPAGDGPVVIDGGCQLETAITVPTASDVTIRGIEVRNVIGAGVYIGNGPPELPRPERVTIDGMTISDFNCLEADEQYNAGIAVFHSACCITITNNTITYRADDPAARGKGNGVWFKSNSERPSGGGHYIAGNVISGGWDGIGGETENDPNGSFDGDTTIENNTVTECWDDGIQVEGGDDNVIVRGNAITGCGTGIALAPVLAGPLTIERNVIRDLEVGLGENQFCFKVGDGGDAVAYLTQNVCQTEGGGVIQTDSGVSHLGLSGNCISVTGYVIAVGDVAPGSSLDGDYLWTTSDELFIAWKQDRYASVTEFRRSTGFEANGRESADCPLDTGS